MPMPAPTRRRRTNPPKQLIDLVRTRAGSCSTSVAALCAFDQVGGGGENVLAVSITNRRTRPSNAAATDSLTVAEGAIERLAAPADDGLAVRDIWLLRLRALLARAHGDAAAYAHFRDSYRDMAKTLGFEGHIAWAEAMR